METAPVRLLEYDQLRVTVLICDSIRAAVFLAHFSFLNWYLVQP